MLIRLFPFLCLLFIAQSCSGQKDADPKAAEIVRQCVEVHGGRNYRNFDVSFDFRAFKVKLQHKGGKFRYERSTKDTLGNTIVDILTNEGLTRSINGKAQTPEDKYRESVNALAYFALLPFKLTEPAVNLKYLGETSIDKQQYDKIEVSFDAEGGGKDYKDVYCYWINQQTHTMDYLSYATGGPRFRKATKRTKVGGIVFQDYDNYEIKDTTLSTQDYDRVFMEGKAVLLSKIEQTNYVSHK
ncbi:MAG TPA: hypothetical protein PLE32_00095 [Haliscomenobacter sp.]|nr:hypothetical protein [Haliscomenobacter sp.]